MSTDNPIHQCLRLQISLIGKTPKTGERDFSYALDKHALSAGDKQQFQLTPPPFEADFDDRGVTSIVINSSGSFTPTPSPRVQLQPLKKDSQLGGI